MTPQGDELLIESLLAHDFDLRLYQAGEEGTRTEADFAGYAPITLMREECMVTPDDSPVASYAQQVFRSLANQPVQYVDGYYLTSKLDGIVVHIEQFAGGPVEVGNVGDEIKVTVTLRRPANGLESQLYPGH